MTTWVEANRLANLAAAQAHGDLGIDVSMPPIDIYGAIGDAGVVLMWRPMPRQFGAYVAEPGSRPGILINNGLPFVAQRQTAGHELGHHRLGHGTRLDADLDAPLARPGIWTGEEKAAEAFAAWFLMPRKAVMVGLARLGLERPLDAVDVYRLSLLLGTPYLTTVRHLPNLRLASQHLASSWARTTPGVVKIRIDPATDKPRSRYPDVWLITNAFAGMTVVAHPGDRLVVRGAATREQISHPDWLRLIPATPEGTSIVLEVSANAIGRRTEIGIVAQRDCGGKAREWTFSIKVEGTRVGIARRWVS